MKYLKFFFIGFAIAGTFHLAQFISCDNGDPVSLGGYSKITPEVDMVKINECAQKVEDAFASGDPAKVKDLLTDDAKSFTYTDIMTELTSERMKSFAEEFKKRNLIAARFNFAEFGFPFQGVTYTVDLAVDKDGSFKLMRF